MFLNLSEIFVKKKLIQLRTCTPIDITQNFIVILTGINFIAHSETNITKNSVEKYKKPTMKKLC